MTDTILQIENGANTAAEALTWGETSGEIQAISHETFKLLSSESLGTLLGTGLRDGLPIASTAIEQVEAASNQALSQFLLAPNTAHKIIWRGESDTRNALEFVQRSLMCESARESRSHCDQITWSARGDYCSGAIRLPPKYATLMVSQETGDCAAHNFGPGIPLDLCSPDRCAGDGLDADCAGESDPIMNLDEEQDFVAQLSDAWRIVAATNDAIAQLVRTFTRIVTVRASETSGYGSSSTLTYPGRTILINPLREGVSKALLAETLVHEAIHTFIYQMEAKNWWVHIKGDKVRSPWSGNVLELHAFVHACFVWYGLTRFWIYGTKQQVLPTPAIESRLLKCTDGFLKSDLAGLLWPFREELNDGILESCECMQQDVRAIFG